ncbi:hypothetical protein [Fontivita pretiosa]|uniref:hypothetical protein n=1 Tax=Fontivita pretiosa TaxID=2989684 RepID=UPI003D168032
MRFTFTGLLSLLLVSLLTGGCAVTPGKSPEQIQSSYSSSGYVQRDFADMHPDLP